MSELEPTNSAGGPDLLPCPFCGSVAGLLTLEDMDEGFPYAIECDGCGARTDYYDTPENAAHGWNTRTPPAEPDGAGRTG